MATRIYGYSDDNISFDGDVCGECGAYNTTTIIACSDGTIATMHYGKDGIWTIRVLRKGELFIRLEQCSDPGADIYSDQLFFKDGLRWAYCNGEKVQ